MSNLNQITFVGSVVADADMQYTPDGTAKLVLLMRVTQETTRGEGDVYSHTSEIAMTAWGDLAESTAPLAVRGQQLMVQGSLDVLKVEANGGSEITSTSQCKARHIYPVTGDQTGFQTVTIRGNLGRDPELRFTPTSQVAVCNLSVALNIQEKVGDKWEDHTEWIKVSVWRKQAELCAEYLHKGVPVIVTGRLEKPDAFKRRNGDPGGAYNVTAFPFSVVFPARSERAATGESEGVPQEDEIPF